MKIKNTCVSNWRIGAYDKRRGYYGEKMRLSELKFKEVINECDCKRLGSICDVEFDCKTGCIVNFIVPGPSKFCGLFGRDCEYVIPCKCVKQMGDDIVLVSIDTSACARKPMGHEKNGDNFFGF